MRLVINLLAAAVRRIAFAEWAGVASKHIVTYVCVTQDEREVKRQRRKQSNRESARRSRLRKQAECEALAVRVNELINENVKLRAANEQLLKLQHLSSHQVRICILLFRRWPFHMRTA